MWSWGGRRGRGQWRVSLKHIIIRCETAVGSCCITRGAQSGALGQPRQRGWVGGWEGGSRRRGYIYLFG